MLCELISARYERGSILITANQRFGAWGAIFPDPAMTRRRYRPARPPRHNLEMNINSYHPGTGRAA